MSTKPYKIEKIYDGRIEYRKIQAWQARNYDGDPANWKQGTPSGNRWLIEKKFVSNDGKTVRYKNLW